MAPEVTFNYKSLNIYSALYQSPNDAKKKKRNSGTRNKKSHPKTKTNTKMNMKTKNMEKPMNIKKTVSNIITQQPMPMLQTDVRKMHVQQRRYKYIAGTIPWADIQKMKWGDIDELTDEEYGFFVELD